MRRELLQKYGSYMVVLGVLRDASPVPVRQTGFYLRVEAVSVVLAAERNAQLVFCGVIFDKV